MKINSQNEGSQGCRGGELRRLEVGKTQLNVMNWPPKKIEDCLFE